MTPDPKNVVRDLAELFHDTDAKTKLEALRIRTSHLRLYAWAAIISAACGLAGVGRWLHWF